MKHNSFIIYTIKLESLFCEMVAKKFSNVTSITI